jgi:hypothetical protein
MRVSRFVKLAVLLSVIFATWFVTSSLVAKQQKTQQQKRNLAKSPPFARETAARGAPSPKPVGTPIKATYECRLLAFDVNVQGGQVKVSSSVALTDRIGDKTYLWRLKVSQEGMPEPIVDVPYVGQMFAIHQSGQMSPTFAETINLPPGKHMVSLSLYGMPHGYDISLLKDETTAQWASVVRGVKKIEVK